MKRKIDSYSLHWCYINFCSLQVLLPQRRPRQNQSLRPNLLKVPARRAQH